MTLNGKRDKFEVADLLEVAAQVRGIDAKQIIHEVCAAVKRWPEIAKAVEIAPRMIAEIGKIHRLYLGGGVDRSDSGKKSKARTLA